MTKFCPSQTVPNPDEGIHPKEEIIHALLDDEQSAERDQKIIEAAADIVADLNEANLQCESLNEKLVDCESLLKIAISLMDTGRLNRPWDNRNSTKDYSLVYWTVEGRAIDGCQRSGYKSVHGETMHDLLRNVRDGKTEWIDL